MNTPTPQAPRDEHNWAQPVDRLETPDLPPTAINLNVEGRQLAGPLTGFGQMWQKTYRIRLRGAPVTPAEVIKEWKARFPQFWPKGNRFYTAAAGIAPGEVAVLNLAGPGGVMAPGGGPLISTGVMVIYADDESFSFMTPQGHMFGGMITFSAVREDETTVAQVQALVRASDPLWEVALRLGGLKAEDTFWQQTLIALARHFGVRGEPPDLKVTLVDGRVQWAQAGNLWHNSAIRTGFYHLAAPLRWLRKRLS